MKIDKQPVLKFSLLLCLVVSGCFIAVGCDSGSSGEDNDGERGGIPTELVGVWKMTGKYRYIGYEETCINEAYPYTDSEGVVISVYLEMDAEGNASKYVKLENLPDFLNEEGYYDGIYHCSSEDKTFSVSDGYITDNYNEVSEYTVSGDTLIITPDDVTNQCVETRQFVRDSLSSISSAVENCDLALDSYDDDDGFYEIFGIEAFEAI